MSLAVVALVAGFVTDGGLSPLPGPPTTPVPGPPTTPVPGPPTTLADRIRPAVVQVVELAPNGEVRGSGSGFIATSDGLVITNHHVLAALTHGEVRFFDGGAVPIEGVLIDDEQQDVAVVKIPGSGYPSLEIVTTEPRVGAYAALLAAPAGLTWTFAEGVVAAYRPDGMPKELLEEAGDETREADKLPVVQFTLSSAGGASGGPIVNEDGAVIAIVRSGMGRMGSITFGIPGKAIVERITASKVAEVKDAGPPRWRNLGISAAFFLGLSVWWVYRSRRRRY